MNEKEKQEILVELRAEITDDVKEQYLDHIKRHTSIKAEFTKIRNRLEAIENALRLAQIANL